MPSTRTFSGYCVDTTKNIDAVGLGCYSTSIDWANCLDLSTTEKLWNICGFHITFGISTSLEGIATSSGNFVTTSKHTYAYARVTKSTKRLFKLYAEVGHAHQVGSQTRPHHWTISSSNIVVFIEYCSIEFEFNSRKSRQQMKGFFEI